VSQCECASRRSGRNSADKYPEKRFFPMVRALHRFAPSRRLKLPKHAKARDLYFSLLSKARQRGRLLLGYNIHKIANDSAK
jgi:hypothetical protein